MFFKESIRIYIQSRYPALQKHLHVQSGTFFKRKSKARKHEVGRGKRNFHWWWASQFKVRGHNLKWASSCLSSPWMVMDEDVPKGWPLPPGISGRHPEAGSVGVPGEAHTLLASHWCSAHTGLFSPPPPAPGLSTGQQACLLAAVISNELMLNNAC